MYQELQAFNATAEEKVALEKIQGCYREESLRNILLKHKIMVIFSLPPLTHATDAVRLCTSDRCNHYYMSCDLQLRTETLAHPSTCKAACHVHSQPVPCMFLQLTPTWCVNMGFSPIVVTGQSLEQHLHRFGTQSSTLRCLKFLSSVFFETLWGLLFPSHR